ncbi:MAG TPA: hypothetical protein VNT99_14980, partial [Methylomirabilota bacterium]|nr:hypothetical protein [Methylomirabilota bacterium]
CTALIMHTFLKCWIAMEAPRRIGTDHRSGALELLISTPLRVEEILRGQWMALLRQFGAAAALVCAVDFLFLSLGLKHTYSVSDRHMWIGIWLAGIAVFVIDLVAIPPVAVWLSLVGRKTSRAGTTSLVLICCLPWLLFGGFIAVIAILDEVFRVGQAASNSGWFFLGVWFALCVVIDLLLGAWALTSLRTRFRIVATQRPESRPAIWGRWLGRKFARNGK